MILVSDIKSLGSTEWDDHKVTKKLLRAFTPRNPTLATIIRRDPKFKIKTPNQLQELVERDVAKSLSHNMNKNIALNAAQVTRLHQAQKLVSQKR
jgi:uncharacterized protein YfaA (DUF2138 family)